MTKESIFKIGMVIALITIVSKVLGLVRDQVITASFGASAVTDAYLAVNNLTGLMLVTFGGVGGAFHLAVMKVISAAKVDEKPSESAKAIGAFTVISLFIGAAVALLMINFADPMVRFFLPGLQPQGLSLAAEDLRIMAPMIPLTVLIGISTGILNAYRQTVIISLNTAVANLIFIGAVLLFREKWASLTLAWSALLSTLIQWIIMLPNLYKTRFFNGFSVRIGDARPVGELFFPMVLASAVGVVNVYIDTAFASTLMGEGNITALNLAARLYILPLGIILMALLLPLFPIFSELYAQKKHLEFRQRLGYSILLLAALTLPISAFFIVMAEPMVGILFQRGSFTPENTVLTAYILICFSVGMIFFVLRDMMSRVFYSRGDSKTPMKIALWSIGLNILLDALLIHPFGVGGLALATVGVNAFNLILMTAILKRRDDRVLPIRPLISPMIRIGLSTLSMTAALFAVWQGIKPFYLHAPLLIQILDLLAISLLAGMLYLVLAYLFKVSQITDGADRILNRVKILIARH